MRSSVRSDRRETPSGRPVRRISSARAPAEREADRAADGVLRGERAPCACGGGCPRCSSAPAAGLGGGRPLDPGTRADFEPRFGRDLGGVRVHDDPLAGASARLIGAQAYAVGADIVFAPGRHRPHSDAGRSLLAHELAHVVLHGHAAHIVYRSEATTEPSAAEVQRLYEEMTKLAGRNAWSGVIRAYEDIEKMGPVGFALARDPAGLHALAAEGARNTGDTRRYLTLLLRTKTALADATGDEAAARRDDIDQVVAGIKAAYGTVDISPRNAPRSEKKRATLTGPALVREVMPFATEQRWSIEAAAKQLAETGFFSGMLPAGVYLLEGETITVISGTENYFQWGR